MIVIAQPFSPIMCVFQKLGSKKKIDSVKMCLELCLFKFPESRQALVAAKSYHMSQSVVSQS